MTRDEIQAGLDALSAHGGRQMLACARYDIDRPLLIDTSSLCLCGEVWSYSSDPNGVFVSDFGTQLRLQGVDHPILTIGQSRTLGGVIVRDLGFAGDLVGMDTRPLWHAEHPSAAAGLVLSSVRTDQCEFSKLSFVGLSSGVCAMGEAEIDACVFEKINTDGCANGFTFMPHASYYAHFRQCIAADNPFYGFYGDGRGRHIHNLEIRETHFVRCGGAFSEGEMAAAVLWNGISRSSVDHCLIDDAGTFWYYDADATRNNQRQPSHRKTVGLWVIGNENRLTDNVVTHSSDDSIRVWGQGNVLMSNIVDGNIRLCGEGNTVVNAVFTSPGGRLILEENATSTTTVIGVPEERILRI